jgi:hypothetical protein
MKLTHSGSRAQEIRSKALPCQGSSLLASLTTPRRLENGSPVAAPCSVVS